MTKGKSEKVYKIKDDIILQLYQKHFEIIGKLDSLYKESSEKKQFSESIYQLAETMVWFARHLRHLDKGSVMKEREFSKYGERYFRKKRLDRYIEELSKAKDETVMANKETGVILGIHESRMETHPRWYRETLFIQNAVYWLCCEGGPESRYECNDGRADNIPLEPEDALNWLETNGFEEQADTLLAIKRNGLLHPDVAKAMKKNGTENEG
jgi:hypothetical protein